jgi:hypothetical protein
MLNMRNAAIAAIASASLSLLAISVAQAQGNEQKPTQEKTTTHRAIYNSYPNGFVADDPHAQHDTNPWSKQNLIRERDPYLNPGEDAVGGG